MQDFKQGTGAQPSDGQEVTFDYVAYNENGNRIDSSYTKGRPASTRLGINGLIPGKDSRARRMTIQSESCMYCKRKELLQVLREGRLNECAFEAAVSKV